MNFDLIIQQCRDLLLNAPAAEAHRQYLNNRLDISTQEKFSFGYFPNGKDIHLLSQTVGEDKLKELKLLFHKNIQDSAYPRKIAVSYFDNQPLIMPYRNVYGEAIALVGRSILNEDTRRSNSIEKYKNTRFSKGNHLFGLYEAKSSIIKSGFVYVVEGQFDVIKAMEKGLYNIVALGSSNMSAYQLTLLCRYTNNILLLLDNDAAGEKGRRAIIEKYGQYANFHNVYLPEGYKDIDEYLNEHDVFSMSLLTKQVMIGGK